MKNYGGKANSLLKLRENNYNVPAFFIIDSSYFEAFLDYNHYSNLISKLLKNKEYEKIKNLILQGKMSSSLEKKIRQEFAQLNSKLVSVRSSALHEDGKEKSFAGQYKTILNVSWEDLYQSIKLCWCSMYSLNVNLYSNDPAINEMNVIIQKMIPADYSGVAFSLDPTSETGNYSVIELVKGLGEKLVSGRKTPFKYIVRRKTLHIDLAIGDLFDEKIIERLEEILLSIEKVFDTPIDIEFAIIKQEIYILQARPITAITPTIKTFSLAIIRPSSLIAEEIYLKGEMEGIKEVTRNLYYFKPLFIYEAVHKTTAYYYNEFDLEEDPKMMYYYMDLDYEKILLKYEQVKIDIDDLERIIENQLNINVQDFVNKLIKIYPFSSLGQLAGHFSNISDRLKTILIDFRYHYDDVIHKSCDYLINMIKKEIPKEYVEFISFITLEEYVTKQLPSLKELKKREKGYLYYDGSLITENYDEWFKKNNIIIQNDETCHLKGNVVFGKNCEGKVCKIFNEEDFEKFEDGDILVTPMTTPIFMKVIKKAKAMITDEGGITCHAAIISRELKIVCIVGCKNATKILKDGDIVKINGSTGEISILNSEK